MAEEWACARGRWVSSAGRLREPKSGKAFVPARIHNAYRSLKLASGKDVHLHTLIAEAFHGPRPSSNHTVHHINGNKLDNRSCNLRWATIAEQNRHRPKFRAAQDRIPIEVNFHDGNGWQWASSAGELVDKFGMSVICINHCLKGRNKSHKGASFRYAEHKRIDGERWGLAFGREVSDHGRVRTHHWNREPLVYTPEPRPDGYAYAFGTAVHILVATAFLPPPPSAEHDSVDHINRIKTDNRPCNLRWATAAEQASNITQNNGQSAAIRAAIRLGDA